MTLWLLAAVVLLVGGTGPALLLSCRGDAVERLVGLELAGAIGVLVMLVLAHAVGESGYLIVPLILAVLSVAGTLVFTRLLGPRP